MKSYAVGTDSKIIKIGDERRKTIIAETENTSLVPDDFKLTRGFKFDLSLEMFGMPNSSSKK